jgi:hypothetical protein
MSFSSGDLLCKWKSWILFHYLWWLENEARFDRVVLVPLTIKMNNKLKLENERKCFPLSAFICTDRWLKGYVVSIWSLLTSGMYSNKTWMTVTQELVWVTLSKCCYGTHNFFFCSSVRFVQFKIGRSIMGRKNMEQEPCYTMLCIIIFAFVKYLYCRMEDIHQ